MKKIFLLILLSTFFIPFTGSAEIYKWVDENGKVHYGDATHTPKEKQQETVELKINTYKNVSVQTTTQSHEKVVMYSASWCGFCKKAKAYFTKNKIPFVEYDIEKDKAAATRHKKMGATGVPVILYKKKRMNGFSESGFEKMYASANGTRKG